MEVMRNEQEKKWHERPEFRGCSAQLMPEKEWQEWAAPEKEWPDFLAWRREFREWAARLMPEKEWREFSAGLMPEKEMVKVAAWLLQEQRRREFSALFSAQLMPEKEWREVSAELIQERMRQKRGEKLPDFLNGFPDGLLRLVPRKHLDLVYEISKSDAEVNRLERLEKDGNQLAADREYRREIRKAVLGTFSTLPRFLIGEIFGHLRRIVVPH
jgi:hypothetical protein